MTAYAEPRGVPSPSGKGASMIWLLTLNADHQAQSMVES